MGFGKINFVIIHSANPTTHALRFAWLGPAKESVL